MAAPGVVNVRAGQRPDTMLVDIFYDLTAPAAPATVKLKISNNSGTLPATSVSGDIGSGIITGANRHIVWNAGIDSPGLLSGNIRFNVTAEYAVPTDAELDPATLEFITRAGSAGDEVWPAARRSLDDLVRESKRLGFWPQMVFVPCRLGFGALNTLGGSPRRTNTKFIRAGTSVLSADGVSFVPGANYANRIQTPFSWDVAHEPVFVGVLGYATAGAHISPGSSFLRWNPGPTGNLLKMYNCGSGEYLAGNGFGTPGSDGGEFFLCNPFLTSIRRPNLAGAQFDGSHTLKCVLNDMSATLTSVSATTGRPEAGPVYFLQPADVNQTHVIQGCLLFYGDVGTLPMSQLWPLLSATCLSDRPERYTYLCQGGQSNSTGETLVHLAYRDWRAAAAPLFNIAHYRYNGAPISYWIGEDPSHPQRLQPYEDARRLWLEKSPRIKPELWNGVYLFIQGESDTTPALASNYLQNIRTLAGFLRQDLRPDLILAIARIDYSVAWRTDPNIADFTVNGCTGAGVSANGYFNVTQKFGLENAHRNYTWTRGSLQVTRDGGPQADRWRIHDAGTTYYLAAEDELHPVAISTWTPMNGATGWPVFSDTRLGAIELVRKAQRDFVKSDSRAFMIDTRGCERPYDAGGDDFVHLSTTNGAVQLADRFSSACAAFMSLAGNSADSAGITLDTEPGYEAWIRNAMLVGVDAELHAIPHHDGIPNLLKYAFNLNASRSEAHHVEMFGISGLPAAEVNHAGENPCLRIRAIRRTNDPAVEYSAEFSDHPASDAWQPSAVPVAITPLTPPWERVVYRDPRPANPGATRFGRIRVNYNKP